MKKFLNNPIFLTAVFSILLFSCNKDEDKLIEEIDNKTIVNFPFCKTGNQWTYTYSSSSDSEITFNTTVNVTSVDENGWVKRKINMILVEYEAWWYAHDNNFSDLASPPSHYLYLYKKEAKVGDVYENTFIAKHGRPVTNRNEVVALNQSITVIAGTFTGCTKIRKTTSEDAVYYADIWFSPEIGIIKDEGTTAKDFPNIGTSELHSINF